MGFLRTIDLSEVKNGEFGLDLKAFGKNRGTDGLKLKINKIKCKIEDLKVAGHWFRVSKEFNISSSLFPRVGEDHIYSFPEQVLHLALKPKP